MSVIGEIFTIILYIPFIILGYTLIVVAYEFSMLIKLIKEYLIKPLDKKK